jgi:hypothetical protein
MKALAEVVIAFGCVYGGMRFLVDVGQWWLGKMRGVYKCGECGHRRPLPP